MDVFAQGEVLHFNLKVIEVVIKGTSPKAASIRTLEEYIVQVFNGVVPNVAGRVGSDSYSMEVVPSRKPTIEKDPNRSLHFIRGRELSYPVIFWRMELLLPSNAFVNIVGCELFVGGFTPVHIVFLVDICIAKGTSNTIEDMLWKFKRNVREIPTCGRKYKVNNKVFPHVREDTLDEISNRLKVWNPLISIELN